MLTATPINNRLSDFRHMAELFTRRDEAYFARTLGVNNLRAHFGQMDATGGLTPDLTLLLDVDVAVGLERRAGAGAANHFDREAVDFHSRVRAGFLELARDGDTAWGVIDASRPLTAVVDDAWSRVRQLL